MMRRDEYVKKIKEYSGVSLQDIRAVMKAMQRICIEAVKNDDAIFVIDGIKVFSKMIPEQEKNIFGEYKIIPAHIKPKASFTPSFMRKLEEAMSDEEEVEEVDFEALF